MKKTIILAAFLTLVLSSCGTSGTLSSCTTDDINKKALLVNATMGEYIQKHPEKAGELQLKFQEVSKQAALADGPLNVCKMYDDFLNFMK